MKKMSFLELEKELEVLSKEESSMSKGGGPPSRDCAFQAFYYIMAHSYGMGGQTEQQLENYYNYAMNPSPPPGCDPFDNADVFGLENINTQGLDWINTCLSNHYNDDFSNFSANYVSGNSVIPNTTVPGESNQYMIIIKNADGSYHAAAFLGIGSDGKYICAEPQLGQGHTQRYSPDKVEGVVVFHEQASTTFPTTTGFSTTTA